MDVDLYGLTLFDGTIFINKDYYSFVHKSKIFIVFLTLFHEYSHILSRLFRGNKDYFYDTGEFIKNNTNKNLKYTEESGNFIEEKLLFNVLPEKSITKWEASYLLNPNNYIYENIDDFHKAFLNYRNLNMNLINNSQKLN